MTIGSKEVFAKNLKMYMESKGKSQKELAKIVGVSAPTMNDWIKAKKFPRIGKIEILADYFGITISDLIEEKNNDTQNETKIRSDASSKTMGEILKDLRLKQHLSLEECSEEIGISAKELQMIENGSKQVSVNTIDNLAHLFGMQSIDIAGIYFSQSDKYENMLKDSYIKYVRKWHEEFGKYNLTKEENDKIFEFARFLISQRKNN